MEERTLLTIRINRKTGQYIVEARGTFRSHIKDKEELFEYLHMIDERYGLLDLRE